MRSTIPIIGGDGDDASMASSSCNGYWWRATMEDGGGRDGGARPELSPLAARSVAALAAMSPEMKVVREMERLASLAGESLDEVRHKILTYKAGDFWFPAGGVSKQETDIPPVITLFLVGFGGVGKTAMVNLMYCVLSPAGFVPFAQTTSPAGKDGRTLCLEEHNVLRSMRNGFCVFDSRGLDYDHLPEGLAEVAEWMEDGVRHRQPCRGANLPESITSTSSAAATKRFARRRVNCPIVVANLAEMHDCFISGNLRPLEATRDLFHSPSIKTSCAENPILVLTHGDELTPEERIKARVRLCEYLDVSETSGVYDISCLNEFGAAVDEMDPVTSYAIAEMVYRALVVADRNHPPKPGMKDWLLLVLSWAMCALSAFFAFLSCFCSKVAKANREYKFKTQ